MTQLQKTTLHPLHAEAGARLIDFGGWEMPVQYRSQVEEHHAVRRTAGIFDVGHMRAVDIEGDDAEAFLRGLLANDVAKLDDGRALYSCMLNARGGVKDDLIIYRRGAGRYRAVLNAATAMADIDWMAEHISGDCRINLRDDRTIVALQGPKATELLPKLVDATLADAAIALKPFRCTEAGDVFIGRTGYTGEDGFEVVLPVDAAADFWRAAVDAGAEPCGLGARDTLRLEAGMNLYGQDMD
ncbi:glycine cleavage system aminomethyltransferase GcvT, partial [Algiphilus sp.]|uniref:glycine cleavage system aminomethyltransferase GcvT n=1 Tax=Algiphilus sp. TaxID=1872431 RepID=UPI003C670A26